MAATAPTLELVDPRRLEPHPRNPRQGDVGAIVESIRSTGWHGVVVGQSSTRQVVAGWHRSLAAAAIIDALERLRPDDASDEAEQWRSFRDAHRDDPVVHGVVPVEWQDLDDDTAVRKLLADNRTNDVAAYDDHALAELLAELATNDRGLVGTGFDGEDLDRLMADLNADDGDMSIDIDPARTGQQITLYFEGGDLAELTAILRRVEGTPSQSVLRIAREWARRT